MEDCINGISMGWRAQLVFLALLLIIALLLIALARTVISVKLPPKGVAPTEDANEKLLRGALTNVKFASWIFVGGVVANLSCAWAQIGHWSNSHDQLLAVHYLSTGAEFAYWTALFVAIWVMYEIASGTSPRAGAFIYTALPMYLWFILVGYTGLQELVAQAITFLRFSLSLVVLELAVATISLVLMRITAASGRSTGPVYRWLMAIAAVIVAAVNAAMWHNPLP